MRALKNLLPHLAIAMLLGLLVIAILDEYNPLMNFLTSGVSKIYIFLTVALGVAVAALYIARCRRD